MLDDFKLDKRSRLPYYYQVYNYLLGKIVSRELSEGSQIPNEMILCNIFQVSRTTIREALRELELNEYISRGRGQGTFILKRSVESSALQKVSSIVDELKEKGINTESKILEQRIIEPDERIRSKLAIGKYIKVLYIKRLVLSDDEPLYITKAYFPNDIFKEISGEYLVNLSFTKILEEHFKFNITGRKRILQPDIPDNDTVSILEIKDSEKKVISHIETFWTFDYERLERLVYFEEYFKGSKSRFIFES
jgi:GntR family transcriptional regulator